MILQDEGVDDFLKIGMDLAKNKKFLDVAYDLETKGQKRTILDRESNEPYLERYYYLNLRPFARIVIHKFLRSDNDGALHNHPWPFRTFILSGGYWEETEQGKFWREPGYNALQGQDFLHRIELDPNKAQEETWTLFLMGLKEQDWGFKVGDNIIQWQEYLNGRRNNHRV